MRFPSFRKWRQRVLCGAGGEGFGQTSSSSIVSWLTGTTSPHTYYKRKPDVVLRGSTASSTSKSAKETKQEAQENASTSFFDFNVFDSFVFNCGAMSPTEYESTPLVDKEKAEKTNFSKFYPESKSINAQSTGPSTKGDKSKSGDSKRKWLRPPMLSKNKKQSEEQQQQQEQRIPIKFAPVSEVHIDDKSNAVVSTLSTPSALLRLPNKQRRAEF